MDKIAAITFVEYVYLLFMYFLFKTSYSFSGASFEKETESLGAMFVHDTGHYENKVCPFGKIMAVVAVTFAISRAYIINPTNRNTLLYATLGFDTICLTLAYFMNLNAFVYILPLIAAEMYLFTVKYRS